MLTEDDKKEQSEATMSNEMVPDEIMEALRFAEFVMAKEKQDRIGSSRKVVYPMKFIFFDDRNNVVGLMGTPFSANGIDEKDLNAFAVRLFANVLNAKAVLHVTEGWVATRCGNCGSNMKNYCKEGRCVICDSEIAAPSENPYREEMLVCSLSIRNHEKAFFWTSRFDRDEHDKIFGFTDEMKCEPMEGEGRFMDVWKLESWMGPHCVVNYPAVAKAMGRRIDKKIIEAAREVEKMAPPDYSFIRLKPESIEEAVTRMKLEEMAREN